MAKTFKSHDDAMVELFKKDPGFAIDMLNSILQEGDQGELMVTLRQMAKAYGGIKRVSERSNVNLTHLYRALSPEGNPELRSLTAILKTMGLRLAVERVA